MTESKPTSAFAVAEERCLDTGKLAVLISWQQVLGLLC